MTMSTTKDIMQSKSSKEIAEYLRGKGFNIIPIKYRTKQPELNSLSKYFDKRCDLPISDNQSIALLHGKISGTWAIDLDHPDIITDLFNDPNLILKNNLVIKTPKQGYHIIRRNKNNDVPPKNMKLINHEGKKIDIKTEGGYTLLPPSIHDEVNGNYQFVSDTLEPMSVSWADTWKILQDFGYHEAEQHDKIICDDVSKSYNNWPLEELMKGGFVRGTRRPKQNSLYVKLRLRGKSESEAEAEVRRVNETCRPCPLDNKEVNHNIIHAEKFYQGIKNKQPKPAEFLPIQKTDRKKLIDIQTIEKIIDSEIKTPKGKELKENYRKLFVLAYDQSPELTDAQVFDFVKKKAQSTFASKNPLDDEAIGEIQSIVRQQQIKTEIESLTPINTEDDERSQRLMVYDLLVNKVIQVVKAELNPDQVIVLVESGGRRYYMDLNDSYLKKLVRAWAQEYYGEVFTDADYQSGIIQYYAKQIIECEEIKPVYQRFAFDKKENCIYYDPNRKDCKIIKITVDGFDYVDYDEKDNPIFIKSPNSWLESGQSDYKKSDTDCLEEFVRLFRLAEDDKMLFKCHLITTFLSGIPWPIIVLNGEQGTAKTTTGKSIKYVVDPDRQLVVAMPDDNKDLAITLCNRALTVFDNVSTLRKDQSDLLCRSVTGAGLSTRTLFTTNEETTSYLMTKCVINGISSVVTEPDLLQRSVIYELSVIPQNERKTDDEVTDKLNEIKPGLLYKVFDTLSNALAEYPKVQKEVMEKPRMAAFALWGEAISRSLGEKGGVFLARYNAKLSESEADLIDKFPILSDIMTIIKDNAGEITITPADLLKKLRDKCVKSVKVNDYYRDVDDIERLRNVPKTPEMLGKEMRKLAPVLRTFGFDCQFVHQTVFAGSKTSQRHIKLKELVR